MSGFEPRSSSIGSDRVASGVTTTAQEMLLCYRLSEQYKVFFKGNKRNQLGFELQPR